MSVVIRSVVGKAGDTYVGIIEDIPHDSLHDIETVRPMLRGMLCKEPWF